MKSKMLGALALLTLIGTLFVMQSAQQHAPTADAAAGSIAALNVGTCLTTDGTVFKGDCDGLSGGSGSDSWEIRDKIAEVSTLYATYAHDPKTQSEAPRAVLADSDLLKISISDSGRDKRSPILVRSRNIGIGFGGDAGDTSRGEAQENHAGALLTIQRLLAADSSVSIVNAGNQDRVQEKIGMTLNYGTGPSPPAFNDAVLANSGNVTLNFRGVNAAHDPMDVEGNIRFFGCTVESGTSCDIDGEDRGVDPTELQDITAAIEVDEDASSGDNSVKNVAPWLAVNASVPTDKDILIYAIYFETSDVENLVGGSKYCNVDLDDSDNCPTPGTNANDGPNDVVFTSDEMEDNSALLVSARADGDLENRHVNLNLKETGRFSGVYQGCVRLTDANGDGRDPNSDPADTTITDWGRQVMDGSEVMDGCAEAAVLAVESGPVTIEYRDSDGSKGTLRIEIDNVPPTITVTSPANGSSSGDQTPDFAGSIEDADSGLADNSFRLVVDNRIDNRDGSNDDFALDDKAPDASEVMTSGDRVTSISDYSGYGMTDPTQFGVVDMASMLYDLGDDACSDDQPECHILSEKYDDGANRGTFDDSLRLDLYETANEPLDVRDREFQIDFQAFVMDMAGNIGFSDSDVANPRYINDLGEADADKRKAGNVLGYYSAHVITLDEKDPVIMTGASATGYYGRNSANNPIADRYGVMVVFDGPIASSSVSNDTFSVELDDGSDAMVVDHEVDGKYVFLKLDSELASDATPMIDIVQGAKVEDMAGNETFGKEQDEFEASDGISPKLTVTLSGGSGSGTGDEGPEKLTKNQIMIHVSSDEPLQGQPQIAVLCSTLRWNEGSNEMDIDDFVAKRNTTSARTPIETPTRMDEVPNKNEAYDYTCGYENNSIVQDFDWSAVPALSRPGENWDYTWKHSPANPADVEEALIDGSLTAVVFARDRSRYPDPKGSGQTVQNWGSSSAEFMLDTELASPLNGGGEVQPADGGTSKEVRPFVLIDFSESTTVTLDSVQLDGAEITSEFTQPETNRFVYWPLTLLRGDHEVDVEASDAAGNEQSFGFSFTVEERGDFLLNLLAGWNAVSVPADPVDTAIGAVFTNPAIDTVIGWDTEGWRIAVRRDGVWESNHQYGALNEIRSRYGYWVKSNNFVRQPIALTANDRGVGGPRQPIAIDTKPGWNFVGVIDQDGDQTEGDSGDGLRAGLTPINAGEYLGSSYVRAYTWDATFNRFAVLPPNEQMKTGMGVWVYYQDGIAP